MTELELLIVGAFEMAKPMLLKRESEHKYTNSKLQMLFEDSGMVFGALYDKKIERFIEIEYVNKLGRIKTINLTGN